MNTTITQEFLTRSFALEETVAVLLRKGNPATTTQRVVRLEQMVSSRYLAWLRYENHAGANIYVGANPLRPGSRKRTKECVAEVRHLYIDIDMDGANRIAALKMSDAVPLPSVILSTSPDKYQALWRVEDFDFDRQETTLKSLALIFGGDSACTDRNRVLRVPGFHNCKYNPAHPVTAEYLSTISYRPEDFRLDDPGIQLTHPDHESKQSRPSGKTSHSEQDWMWVVQQLSQGADAGMLTLALASARSDKPNPLYYAQRTIDMASARLALLDGMGIDEVIAMLKHRRSAEIASALCSSRAREIARTAQRMISRNNVTPFHTSKENHNATA
jgi:hypothetical protein